MDSTMPLVILLSMAALASSASLDVDLCAEGESFWCQSFANAEGCSAVDHCMETIWRNQKLEKDVSNVCLFCQAVISDGRQMMTDGKSQEEIVAFLSSANDLLPDTDMVSQIKRTIESKSMQKILNSEIEPQMVCGLLSVCNGPLSQDLHQLESSSEEETPNQPEELNDILQPSSCDDCKKFFTALKNLITTQTSSVLTDLILDKLCSRTTSFKTQCEDVAKNYLPATLKVLTSFLDEAMVCKGIRMCQRLNTGDDEKPFEINLRFLDFEELTSLLTKNSQAMLTDEVGQPSTCADCKNLFTAIKSLIQAETSVFIQDIILDQVCGRLGKQRNQCETTVKSILIPAIRIAASFLDPDKACKSTKLCPKSSSESDLNSSIRWTKILRPNETNMLLQPTSCPDCTKFFTSVQALIKGDASAFLSDVLIDQLCPLAGQYRQQCADFAKTYLPVVIGMVANSLDPKKICTSIRMCPKSENDIDLDGFLIDLSSIDWKTLIENEMLLQPTSCPDCTKFFTSVQALIKGDASAFLSDILIDQLCPLAGQFRQQCADFAKTYLPVVIGMVANSLDPKKVCKAIRMCPKSENEIESDDFLIDLSLIDWETLIGNQSSDGKCETCKKTVQYIQTLLKSVAVKTSITMILKKFVCVFLGPFSIPCQQIVGPVIQYILDFAANLLDPLKVCRVLRLCSKSDVFLENSVPVLEGSEDLGPVECTVCESVVDLLRAAIDNNMTEAEILSAMHGVCNQLPSRIAVATCNRMVTRYGPQILESFRRQLQPHDVCRKLGLCSLFNSVDLMDEAAAVMGSQPCVICRSAVQYAEALMDEKDTVSAIQSQLKVLCHSLSPTVESEICLPFVTKYVPPLIHELSVLLPPKCFCTKIRICLDDMEE